MSAFKIEMILRLLHVEYVKEYKFSTSRRFRFDFALLNHKVAIEHEGIISGKSRHTTIKGYSKDCEKYNLAAVEGWKVLRYTAINFGSLQEDLKRLLKA